MDLIPSAPNDYAGAHRGLSAGVDSIYDIVWRATRTGAAVTYGDVRLARSAILVYNFELPRSTTVEHFQFV